jgi:hypothetical protein
MHIILVDYKSNILQLIYAEVGRQLHLQSALPLLIANNRSISDDGGKTIEYGCQLTNISMQYTLSKK